MLALFNCITAFGAITAFVQIVRCAMYNLTIDYAIGIMALALLFISLFAKWYYVEVYNG